MDAPELEALARRQDDLKRLLQELDAVDGADAAQTRNAVDMLSRWVAMRPQVALKKPLRRRA